MTEKAVLRVVARSVLLIALIAAIGWFAWEVRGVLVLVLVSVILATGLSPVVDAMSGHQSTRLPLRVPRALAVLLLYLVLIAGLALIVLGIIPPLVNQVEELADKAPGYVQDTRQTLRDWEDTYPFLQELDARLLAELERSLVGIGGVSEQAARLFRFALGVVNALFSTVVVLVLTFYLIVGGNTLRRGALRLVPMDSRPLVAVVVERVRLKIGAWLVGQILLSAIIGTSTFFGLILLGVPYALLLSVIAAIGELIPMLGPVVSAIPAVILATMKSPLLGLLTVVLYILIQQLENHIVVPQVMRRAVDLPPAVIIVTLMMGGQVLGIVGAILAVPVTAIVSVIVSELIALRDGQIAAPAVLALDPDAPAAAEAPAEPA